MPYVYRYENGAFTQFEKPVVREQPFTIMVNGVELATFLCTPVKLDYLVIGFLCFEGIISGLDDIRALDVDADHGRGVGRTGHRPGAAEETGFHVRLRHGPDVQHWSVGTTRRCSAT